ncbi:MAG: SNF2-related protein [Verrucomicrobiae bacterium]|nr:SNF2-related protein [Verrucomicrobiae bacterium]
MEITREFLIDLAGWDVMKHARAMLEFNAVAHSDWSPPVLKGLVQDGPLSYRAGLIVKNERDIENLCTCRDARQRGIFCAHSVAVGLHHLRRKQVIQNLAHPPASDTPAPKPTSVSKTAPPPRRLQQALPGQSGELLELCVIFPPNFSESIPKKRFTLFFEGRWKKGRSPLSGLPTNIPFSLSPQDRFLLDAIEKLGDGSHPAMLPLDSQKLCVLLPKLIDHPRATLGKSQPLSIQANPCRFGIVAHLESTGEIILQKAAGQGPLPLIEGEQSWVFQPPALRPLGIPPEIASLLHAPIKISRQQIPDFLSRTWPKLEKNCDIQADFKSSDFSFSPLNPSFTLELSGGLARMDAWLRCSYAQQTMTLGAPANDIWLADPQSPTRYSTRHAAAEAGAIQRLQRAGFTGPNEKGLFQLAGQNKVLLFIARDFPQLQKAWKITVETRLDRSMKENIEVIEPQFSAVSSGEQWFDLDVAFQSKGGERFSAGDIQQLLLKGQNYTTLKNGRLGILNTDAVHELQEALLDASPRQQDGKYRLDSVQIGFLDETIRQQNGWAPPSLAPWRDCAARQRGEAKFEIPPLGALDSILRPYQKTGIGWLNFLRENQFGGILADEMGLGKTLQVLAFLQSLKNQGQLNLPCLVVCPTSLTFNWASEAAKFTPGLRTLVLHGTQRHDLFGKIAGADLVITSYGLMRRDADRHRDLEWDTVILDEAQHIKNRQTQNAQAVKAARSRHRLVLTGTPMENSVLDLWSIFDFLMPEYLGTARDFKDRYELPITRDKDPKAQTRLARRTRPFLLRRLKKEVTRDLPEKIEQTAFCELSDDQRAIYQQMLEAGRREVTAAVGAQGLPKSRMLVLSALLRLRQICCDLRLLQLDAARESNQPSGKLELFSELLDEVLDGGHRVLVFSQFVSMLTLLRERLEEEGVACSYLDGSTVDRAKVVEQFQTDEKIPVFLISLKAGGVGLNLTGADTVIHFDPWWNPAVEDQATDRAHRIGQTRLVTSYKLITRGTVEEKILNLQNRKRDAIRNILGTEDQLVETLNWEEIQELLSEG